MDPQIAVGDQAIVGLKSDGTVVALGGPFSVGGWSEVVQIDASWTTAVGLRADGTVVASGDWGSGAGCPSCEVGSWTEIVQVAASAGVTLGLRADGTVAAAGDLSPGGPGDVMSWTGMTQVATGGRHSLGLRADGTVVSTADGSAFPGVLGAWSDVVQVAAGGNWESFGLRNDGTVLAAGPAWTAEVSSWTGIVQIAATTSAVVGLRADGTVAIATILKRYDLDQVRAWSNITAVDVDQRIVGLKADGTVVADPPIERAEEWNGLVQVAAGYDNSVGLKADGTLTLTLLIADPRYVLEWRDIVQVCSEGYDYVGLRSDGTVLFYSIPECPVAALTQVVQIAGGHQFFIALRQDGTVQPSWGTEPLPWGNRPGCAAAGCGDVEGWSDVVQVAAGESHSVGLLADGRVVAVGENDQGQCEVSGWTGIIQVAANRRATAGLQADGSVVAAGRVADASGLSGIVRIAVGGEGQVFGIRADGSVDVVARVDDVWGANAVGEWRDIVQIASTSGRTVGLKADGTAVSVGDGYTGSSNVGALFLTPTAGEPEVTVSHLRFGRAGCPDSVELVARIANVGPRGSVPPIKVAFYLGDPAAGGALLGVAETSQALAPAESEDIAVTVTPPLQGHQTVWVVADDDGTGAGVLPESQREHNQGSLLMKGFCDLDLDLVVNDFTTSAGNCPDSVGVSVWISNLGSDWAPSGIDVAVYAMSPGGEFRLLQVVQTQTKLQPGGCHGETVHATISPPPTWGDVLWVVADDDGSGSGRFPEIDEENNGLVRADVELCPPFIARDFEYSVTPVELEILGTTYTALNDLGEIVAIRPNASGVPNVYSSTRGWLTSFTSTNPGDPRDPDINNDGEVVYSYRNGSGLRVWSTVRGKIADGGSRPRINNSGEIVYFGQTSSFKGLISTVRGPLVALGSVGSLDLNDAGEVLYSYGDNAYSTTRGFLGRWSSVFLNNEGDVLRNLRGYGQSQVYSMFYGYVTKPSLFPEPAPLDLSGYGPEDGPLLGEAYAGDNVVWAANYRGQILFRHAVLEPYWNVDNSRWLYRTKSWSFYLATATGLDLPGMRPVADAGGPYFFEASQAGWIVDGSGSVNPDEGLSEPGFPGDTLREFAWDLDGDGMFDDALGMTPDARAFYEAAGAGVYDIGLRVTDTTSSSYPSKALADLNDVAAGRVYVLAAPEAAAGGPYALCPDSLVLFLDARASVNADDGDSEDGFPGDRIQEYAWDLDGDGAYDDAIGATPEVRAFFGGYEPGTYSIGLRVLDTTASSYPGSGLGDLVGYGTATLVIRGTADTRCGCVSNLSARAKPGKIDLVWQAGVADRFNVYRGFAKGGPYVKVGTVTGVNAWVDATAVNGVRHYYVIRSMDATGHELCPSNEASATPSARVR